MEENIDQKIELNETRIEYKNHLVWLQSFELKSGGWTPKALVLLPEEEGNGEHELQGEVTLAAREDADKHALLMGKQWIDQKVAERS